jgi:hypothetical protein
MKTAADYFPQYTEIASAISKLMMDVDMTKDIRLKLSIGLGSSLVAMASQHNPGMGIEIVDAIKEVFLESEQRRNTFSEN